MSNGKKVTKKNLPNLLKNKNHVQKKKSHLNKKKKKKKKKSKRKKKVFVIYLRQLTDQRQQRTVQILTVFFIYQRQRIDYRQPPSHPPKKKKTKMHRTGQAHGQVHVFSSFACQTHLIQFSRKLFDRSGKKILRTHHHFPIFPS